MLDLATHAGLIVCDAHMLALLFGTSLAQIVWRKTAALAWLLGMEL